MSIDDFDEKQAKIDAQIAREKRIGRIVGRGLYTVALFAAGFGAGYFLAPQHSTKPDNNLHISSNRYTAVLDSTYEAGLATGRSDYSDSLKIERAARKPLEEQLAEYISINHNLEQELATKKYLQGK